MTLEDLMIFHMYGISGYTKEEKEEEEPDIR